MITHDPFGNQFEFCFPVTGDIASGDLWVGYQGGEVFVYDEHGYIRCSVNNIKLIAEVCDQMKKGLS